MTELKPCPFCGSEVEIDSAVDNKYHWAHCSNRSCLLNGPVLNSKESVIKHWNTRAGKLVPTAELERLRLAEITCWQIENYRDAKTQKADLAAVAHFRDEKNQAYEKWLQAKKGGGDA